MRLNAYTLPLIISLLLHALVLGLVFQKWESTHKPRKVEIPQHVQAQIVDFNPRAEEEARQAEEQRIIDLRRRQEEQARREAEQRRQQEAERDRKSVVREREKRAGDDGKVEDRR